MCQNFLVFHHDKLIVNKCSCHSISQYSKKQNTPQVKICKFRNVKSTQVRSTGTQHFQTLSCILASVLQINVLDSSASENCLPLKRSCSLKNF